MRLLIYGSRDFAATVAELVRHCEHEAVGFVDDFNTGDGILGSLETVRLSHPPETHGMVMAIGYKDLTARWRAWERVRRAGYCSPSLIHPRAYVADTATVEDGAFIMAGAIVDVHARVGELAVLWPGACVNHDAVIGRNVFISPNATVCGNAQVGGHSFIGAGAALVDFASVPEASFIKMLERYSKKNA